MKIVFDQPTLMPIGPSGRWIVVADWAIRFDGLMFVVPRKFDHDRASIPWFLLSIISKDSVGAAGPLIHDYLYATHQTTRAVADRYFRLTMAADGVAAWRRNLAWAAVRLFGWFAWRKSFRRDKFVG